MKSLGNSFHLVILRTLILILFNIPYSIINNTLYIQWINLIPPPIVILGTPHVHCTKLGIGARSARLSFCYMQTMNPCLCRLLENMSCPPTKEATCGRLAGNLKGFPARCHVSDRHASAKGSMTTFNFTMRWMRAVGLPLARKNLEATATFLQRLKCAVFLPFQKFL